VLLGYSLFKKVKKGEGVMNRKIKGIVVLLFIVAVTIVPLSVRAEMEVMTDNEMQSVTGQASLGSILGTLTNNLTIVATNLGLESTIHKMITKVVQDPCVATILKEGSKSPLYSVLLKLLNTEIPGTK